MPTAVVCPACRGPFWVRDESAGARVTCPYCPAPADAGAGWLRPEPAERPGPPPPPPGAWRAFATGCALSRWGAWVEFAGLALGAAWVTYQALWRDGKGGGSGPLALAAFFAVLVVAAGLACVGRWKMADVPDGTGAKGVFAAALVFAALRLLATGTALFLVLAAADAGPGDPAGGADRLGLAVLAWAAPSPALRRRAGHVTVGLQVVIGLSVALSAGLAYAAESSRADRVRTTAAVGFLVGLQLAYTALFSALYAAGARAEHDARAAGPPGGGGQV